MTDLNQPPLVTAAARRYGIRPDALDWHVQVQHDVDPLDMEAVEDAALCFMVGSCSRLGSSALPRDWSTTG